jgi:pilus assembly protein CpaF
VTLNSEVNQQVDTWWEHFVPYCPSIEPHLRDESISEIEVNPSGELFIEKDGTTTQTSTIVPQSEVESFVTRLARWRGQDISAVDPLLSVKMPEGSRVSAMCPPVCQGWCFTIRKHAEVRWTLTDLIKKGSISSRESLELRGHVEARNTILISGGTSTGKTSMVTALSRLIPPSDRIILIEDVSEIQIDQPNVVRCEAQPAGDGRKEITIRDLVKHSLRFTANRIIVGEVRGPEAFDLLQVLNSGHVGSLSTVHANSPVGALTRIVDLTMQADVGIVESGVKKRVASAVNIIVQVERHGAQRRVSEIVKVLGYDSTRDEFKLEQLCK